MQYYLSVAKMHKSYIRLDTDKTRHKLMLENLALARKMSILYLNCTECPHGISITGLRLAKIH